MSGVFFSFFPLYLPRQGPSSEWRASRYGSSPSRFALGLPCLCAQGPTGITGELPRPPGVYMSLGDLNSGPCAHTARALTPWAASPAPKIIFRRNSNSALRQRFWKFLLRWQGTAGSTGSQILLSGCGIFFCSENTKWRTARRELFQCCLLIFVVVVAVTWQNTKQKAPEARKWLSA